MHSILLDGGFDLSAIWEQLCQFDFVYYDKDSWLGRSTALPMGVRESTRTLTRQNPYPLMRVRVLRGYRRVKGAAASGCGYSLKCDRKTAGRLLVIQI